MDKNDGCAPNPELDGRRLMSIPRLSHLVIGLLLLTPMFAHADSLAKIRERGILRYGSDAEGGGPFIYANPKNPLEVTGFEPELIAKLCGALGPKPVYTYARWDTLLQVLRIGDVDVVFNGYELTANRKREYLPTRPYYIYQLQLMVPTGGAITTWDDVKKPRSDGRKWRIGVLGLSSGDIFANDEAGPHVEVVSFEGATDAMMATVNGQVDATLQDLPASRFYLPRFSTLVAAGPPVGRGYYVIYCRKEDAQLVEALNRAIGDLISNGDLKRIYDKYNIWTDLQEELLDVDPVLPAVDVPKQGLALVWQYRWSLFDAAWMTFWISVMSMPLAMAIGLIVALGRLYGPSWLAGILGGYVEILRGTPLMLQLYVLYFVLKLPAPVAAVAGLAINYSAYEAEIYRAGLQAIPAGQMEAALALGMSKWQALGRIIVPQAVRIVIPAVTNDFIALFKDTSVCSVITIVELTKQYSMLGNSTDGMFEFALATAAIYMMMSVPLSVFSRWSERKLGLGGDTPKGGLV